MLTYRAANLRDREKWLAILDEGFIFTLPLTPYRYVYVDIYVQIEFASICI
jgi:hypothetical protein